MKVSELGGRIDTLVSLAIQYKNTSTSSGAAQLPPDDPEVQALADRIDDAIAVLQGTKTASSSTVGLEVTPGTSATIPDPNAPVT